MKKLILILLPFLFVTMASSQWKELGNEIFIFQKGTDLYSYQFDEESLQMVPIDTICLNSEEEVDFVLRNSKKTERDIIVESYSKINILKTVMKGNSSGGRFSYESISETIPVGIGYKISFLISVIIFLVGVVIGFSIKGKDDKKDGKKLSPLFLTLFASSFVYFFTLGRLGIIGYFLDYYGEQIPIILSIFLTCVVSIVISVVLMIFFFVLVKFKSKKIKR